MALAATALTLAVPRAAHAVAAALVQVTNTAASPAMTQSVNQQAAQQLELNCLGLTPGTFVSCEAISPSGGGTPNYAIPANQFFMITSVDIIPVVLNSCPGGEVVLDVNGSPRQNWLFTGSPGMLHFGYPNGLVLAPGSAVTETTVPTNGCGAIVNLFGYLASN